MAYVDGFVLAVPKANIDAYKKMANDAGAVWKEHGALTYVEAIGDDVPYGELTSFPRAVQAKDDEVVIFSWVTYASRAARDDILKKVMADPRMNQDMANNRAVQAKRRAALVARPPQGTRSIARDGRQAVWPSAQDAGGSTSRRIDPKEKTRWRANTSGLSGMSR